MGRCRNSSGCGRRRREPVVSDTVIPTAHGGKQARATLNGHRGIPDISYNADDLNSAILVYTSFLAPIGGPDSVGYYLIGGTSEGAPQWAGIVADLNQLGHAPMGFLNPKLYALGGLGLFTDFGRDITKGSNAYGGVPGYSATRGWDPASGWGTPNLISSRGIGRSSTRHSSPTDLAGA